MFLRNAWYVVAWDHELPAGKLLSRRVLDEPVLLYRTPDGRAVALADRCCHRHAPLSLGRLEGDCVRCMYHGLKFDPSGRCVEVPGQSRIPSTAAVRSYPVVERNRWVWLWPGEPNRADAAEIPDTFSLASPDWRMSPGYMKYDANYRLILDNLLDFSHLAFVHPTTLGGTEKLADTRPDVRRLERGVRVERWLLNVAPAPFHSKVHSFAGTVDRWWFYDFLVPGILLMHSGAQPTGTGAPQGRHSGALEFRSCQAVTPACAETSHYFFAVPRNFALDDAQIDRSVMEDISTAFAEDQKIIEAQHRNIDHDQAMLPIGADLALTQFRRIFDSFVESESGSVESDVAVSSK